MHYLHLLRFRLLALHLLIQKNVHVHLVYTAQFQVVVLLSD